jgi:2-polyprenyl-6-methoxyphenol hydroxylase-like FAD-dependent oxidoreductase
MPRIAVLGGSVVGSVTALLFARSGWRVDLVDPELDAFSGDEPDELRSRPGAPHTVQAHGFMSRTLFELTTRLPDVRQALEDAGAVIVRPSQGLPPHLYDGGRPDDHELDTMRVRRVTLDRVLARFVAAEPLVRRLPERVEGLDLEPGSPPRVRGLRVGGSTLEADLVVDAGGRRSPVAGWLADAGVVVPERRDPCVSRYYTRHFRVVGEPPGLNLGYAEVHQFPCLTQLMFLGDRSTAMLAQAVHDEDTALKSLRHPDAFQAVLRANEALAEWYAALEPTSQVFCLGAFDNRMRSLVLDGEPLVLGLHPVGDSLALTNPTRGRGIAMGLAAAGRLHDLAAMEGCRDAELTTEHDAWCQRVLGVYYRESAVHDAAGDRRLRAGLLGRSVPGNAPAIELPEGHPVSSGELEAVARLDPDLIRLVTRATMCLDDDRRIGSPEVAARVRELTPSVPEAAPAPEALDGLHVRANLVGVLAAFS